MARSEVPAIAKPVKTWQLVEGFIGGLKGMVDVQFEELVTVPTIAGSYNNIGDDKAKRLGNASTWYVGYVPVFDKSGTSPIAYDVCFHTSSMGVVPMLRIGGVGSLDPELVDEINDLKLKANRVIAQRLEECGCNEILVRYQWYACLLEHLDIPIKPSEAKEKVASVVDAASDEAGVSVRGKFGINTDDSSVAIKVLDHLGFIFKAPRKMTSTYPFDLNAYTVSLLKDGNHYQVIVTHDLEPYMTGSKAEILPEYNGAVTHFRPLFAKDARTAGQLFLKQVGLPTQTSILTDEDPAEALSGTHDEIVLDIPEVEPEVSISPPTPQPASIGLGRRFPRQVPDSADTVEEREAREYLREQGYRLIEEGKGFLLLREVAMVRDVIEAADLIEEEEEVLYNLPEAADDYFSDERTRPWENNRPSAPPRRVPSAAPSSPSPNQRRIIHPRNGGRPSEMPPRPKMNRASRSPVREDQEANSEAVIEIGRDRNSRAYTARFDGEVIAEDRSFDRVQDQVNELVMQHPDFRNAKVMYRSADGTLLPSKPSRS